MPYIDIKVAGKLTKEQKEKICSEVTRVISEITKKKPESHYVVIEEVERENWAVGGKLLG
ncbi:4-oxalocrotonate tautomerase family protein [Candidatus Woesearchaeota archaeon]|nr:4-oxalocrotonate tautomerase family protein [Candidatus Woesearchaeota archaeon]